jgi:hypothetical protein
VSLGVDFIDFDRLQPTMYNQHGQAVYAFIPMTIVPRRPDT